MFAEANKHQHADPSANLLSRLNGSDFLFVHMKMSKGDKHFHMPKLHSNEGPTGSMHLYYPSIHDIKFYALHKVDPINPT